MNGSVIINSNLTVLGETTYLYTDVYTTEQLIVNNEGNGVAFDLTQKNMLVNKQKKLTETIENIIQFAPESLVVVDHQKNIFKKNKAFYKLINEYAPKLQYTKPELKKLILQQILDNTLDDGKKTITIEKNEKNKKI